MSRGDYVSRSEASCVEFLLFTSSCCYFFLNQSEKCECCVYPNIQLPAFCKDEAIIHCFIRGTYFSNSLLFYCADDKIKPKDRNTFYVVKRKASLIRQNKLYRKENMAFNLLLCDKFYQLIFNRRVRIFRR